MSDVRYKLSDGRIARVKPESVRAQEALWAERGVEFMPVEAPVVAEPMAPGPGFMQPQKAPPPAKPLDAPGLGDDVAAFGRGAGQGASLGFGDEMGGLGAALTGDVPRMAGRGMRAPVDPRSTYEVGRDEERAANRAAEAAHPGMYGTGKFVGGMAPAIATGAAGGVAGAALGAGRVATAAGVGAALGAGTGAGESEAETVGGVAADTAMGGVVGGALGAGTEIAAPYVAQGARWAGGKLKQGAQALRPMQVEQKLAAAGVERAGMRKLRDKPGGLERFAEGAERMEIGRNRLGVIPASVRQHAADAEKAMLAARAGKDALAGDIEAAGVTVDGRDVAARLRALGAQYEGPAGKDLRAVIDEVAGDYDQFGIVPFETMNKQRQLWGDATNFDSASVKQKLRKKIYGLLNEAMSDAADNAAAPMAPMSGQSWRRMNEDEYVARKLSELGENKLNQAGNRGFSPTDYAAAGVGYMASANPLTAAAAVGGNKLLRSREHALAYNALKGTRGALSAGGDVLQGAAGVLERAPAGARGAAGAAIGTPRFASPAMAQGSGNALDDEKYGALLQQKQGQDREAAYSLLMSQDAQFRARMRAKAAQAEEKRQ